MLNLPKARFQSWRTGWESFTWIAMAIAFCISCHLLSFNAVTCNSVVYASQFWHTSDRGLCGFSNLMPLQTYARITQTYTRITLRNCILQTQCTQRVYPHMTVTDICSRPNRYTVPHIPGGICHRHHIAALELFRTEPPAKIAILTMSTRCNPLTVTPQAPCGCNSLRLQFLNV